MYITAKLKIALLLLAITENTIKNMLPSKSKI